MGCGPKSSVCPSKPRETKLFWRDIPGFCRDILEVPEKFEKKRVSVQFLAPIKTPSVGHCLDTLRVCSPSASAKEVVHHLPQA